MAFYKQDIVDVNLETGVIHRSFLNHTIGHKDDDADRFGIRAFRNGEPVDLSGAQCQAVFMAPDGTNIALTSYGTVSGNEAYVTLPQACYNVEGQFCLAIKLVGGGVTATVRIIDGVVDRTGATGAVAPTEAVPTYQEILAVYAEMQEDIADYESVVANQNGKIDDLKSAFDSTLNHVAWSPTILIGKYVKESNGKTANYNAYARTSIWVKGNNRIAVVLSPTSSYKCYLCFYGDNGSLSTGANFIRSSGVWESGIIYLPTDIKEFAVTFKRIDDADMSASDESAIMNALSILESTDKTLSIEGKSADAKATGDNIAEIKSDIYEPKNIIPIKNRKIIKQDLKQGSYLTTGVYAESTARIRTKGIIPVKKGDTVSFTFGVNTTKATVGFWDVDFSNMVETHYINVSSAKHIVKNDGYIIIVYYRTIITDDITVDDYDAVTVIDSNSSNSISDDFDGIVGKKNLFEKSNLTYGAYINDDGEITEIDVGRYTTNVIPITHDCFTINFRTNGTDVWIRVLGYDENDDFVRLIDKFTTGTGVYTAEKSFGAASDVVSIRISYSINVELLSVINGYPVKTWLMDRRYSDMKSYGKQPSADGSSGSFCNTLSGNYADLLTAVYEPLRTQYPNYVSRKVIGRDASDTYDIYAYTFEPRYYQQSILLNSGIHSKETDSIACLARFCQMVANATSAEPDLYYIRQNVKMTVVPVANVWGFSQSPHNMNNADGLPIQRFTTLPLIAEDQALVDLVESLKDELSFVVDMHTTTNDTYLDFYGVINRYCPNVRTLFKVNAWLCDHYAKDGRTVDDQYFGYRTSTHTFNAFCWNTYRIPCSTLELSDYHWGDIGSEEAITMGVTMYANYIIQQINDSYNRVDVIPFADYREVKG